MLKNTKQQVENRNIYLKKMRIILFSLLQARSVLFTGEVIERLRLFKFSVLIGCEIPSMRIGGFFHYA